MKSLFKNSVYNVIYKALNVFFPLVIAAYVSRILLADGVGKVSAADNIAKYFVLVAALGLPSYGTKKIAEMNNKQETSNTFWELFIINSISTVICTASYYFLINYANFFEEKKLLYSVSGILIPFNFINVDWFYQGREEYRYIMIRSIIVKILSLILIFIFVRTTDDFIIYAVILVFSKGFNYIFNIINLRKYIIRPNRNLKIIHHLSPVFALLAASIAIEIYTLADTTMLNVLKGDAIVGYYTTALKGINFVKTIVVAICAVFLPRLSYYYKSDNLQMFKKLANKGINVLINISIPAALGIFLVSSDAISIIFGTGFLPATSSMKILSFSVITVSLSNFIGYQVLVSIGKERIMLISTIAGALTNVILNFFLIPVLSMNGAAIASISTEALVIIIQYSFARKDIGININLFDFFKICIGSILMTLVVIIMETWIHSVSIRLLMCIIVGVLVYFATEIVLKNQIISYVINKVIRR